MCKWADCLGYRECLFNIRTGHHHDFNSGWWTGFHDTRCNGCHYSGKRIGLKQRLLIQQATNTSSAQGLVKLSMYIVLIAFAFEALATVVLTLRWQSDLGWGQAFYYALYSIPSLPSIMRVSLFGVIALLHLLVTRFVNLTVITLFIIGGLGYIVVVDVFRKRSWRKLSLHSKIVLIGSFSLYLFGFITIFFTRELESFYVC